MKWIITAVLCLLTVSYVTASEDDELGLIYKDAKELYHQERYKLSMELFDMVSQKKRNNPYHPYARYYYASAALKLNKPELAYQTLATIRTRRTDKMLTYEIYFLQANASFELGWLKEANEYLRKCRHKQFEEGKNNMKRHYLNAPQTNTNDLKALYEKYSEDEIIADALYAKLMKLDSITPDDKILIEELTDAFGFKSKRPVKKSEFKETYNVSILLPFMLSEVSDGETIRGNKLAVADMYRGIRIAKEDLADKGINLTLKSFDTEKKAEKLKSILDSNEIAQSDLIIGPVNASLSDIAAGFAEKRKAVVVNPVYTEMPSQIENPYFFTFTSGPETTGKAAAEFMEREVGESRVAVLFGKSKKDSTAAQAFRLQADEDGSSTVLFKAYTNETLASVYTDLKNKENIDFIVVHTEDIGLLSSVIKTLRRLRRSPAILTLSDLINPTDPDLLDYEKLYFLYPYFADHSNENVQQFTETFFERENTIPSDYAYLGYDLMYYFGKLMKKYGTGFGDKLTKTGFLNGQVLGGCEFSETTYDNRFVPIVKIEDGKPVLVNK